MNLKQITKISVGVSYDWGINNRNYVISRNPKNEGGTWKVITWGPLRWEIRRSYKFIRSKAK